MNTAEQKNSGTDRISKTISSWAEKNRKTFWKYEVSCFYKTYVLRISNLPEPSVKDIKLSPNNRLLSEEQKKQLCTALAKTCGRADVSSDSTIDVQIDYDDGSVITEVM